MTRASLIAALVLAAACDDGRAAHSGPRAGECRDPDGDGFGLYCERGPDCDETSPDVHTACAGCSSRPELGCPCSTDDAPVECHSAEAVVLEGGTEPVCQAGERRCVDGAWGECIYETTYAPVDGANAGAGIIGDPTPCGDCDLQCAKAEDDLEEDDLTDDNSDGVVWDPLLGGIVIGGGTTQAPYAWIANVSDGTVSKIEQFTGAEVGRYYADAAPNWNLYPSRTAIDAYGNAYVGNRMITGGWWGPSGRYGSVTKFAGDATFCRNGAATTSVDSVPLAFGTDDCVLWTAHVGTREGAMVRAVAISHGDDVHPDGYVWVGATNDVDGGGAGRAYKLDPDTGATVCSVQLPISAYGATSDGGDPERVWFSSIMSGQLTAVDADTCAVVGTYTPGDPWNCGLAWSAYGVTTDGDGRIWQAGWGCGTARRYDPATDTWCYADTRGYGNSVGVTVDTGRTDGVVTQAAQVWISHASWPSHLSHWDKDVDCVSTPICVDTLVCLDSWGGSCWSWGWNNVCTNYDVVPPASIRHTWLPAGNDSGWGVGVDFTDTNRIWVIGNGQARASIYDPIAGTTVQYPTTAAPLAGPYTYSDFTGYQFRAFVNPEGYYWHDYGDPVVCGPGQRPTWASLTWDADTPAGTHIRFEARTADTDAGLDVAPVVDLGDTPPETSPPGIDVGAVLLAAGQPDNDRFIRIRVVLVSDDDVSSPVFRGHTLTWTCTDSE